MVWSFGFENIGDYGTKHKLLDSDKDKVTYVDPTPEWRVFNGRFDKGTLNLGRPLKPDFLPSKIMRWGKKRGLPDGFQTRSFFVVNDRFKDIVEGLEPNRHQFFPVEVVWDDGSHAAHMYIFNICNSLDTVDREKSTATLDGRVWLPETGTLVFSLEQIGNHHVWVDKLIYRGILVSDALKDAMVKEGLTGVGFVKFNNSGDK